MGEEGICADRPTMDKGTDAGAARKNGFNHAEQGSLAHIPAAAAARKIEISPSSPPPPLPASPATAAAGPPSCCIRQTVPSSCCPEPRMGQRGVLWLLRGAGGVGERRGLLCHSLQCGTQGEHCRLPWQ